MKTPQVKPNWATGIYIGNGVVATPKKKFKVTAQSIENYTATIEATDINAACAIARELDADQFEISDSSIWRCGSWDITDVEPVD